MRAAIVNYLQQLARYGRRIIPVPEALGLRSNGKLESEYLRALRTLLPAPDNRR